MLTLNGNNGQENLKSILSDKESSFYKILDVAKKSDPAVKDLIDSLNLITQHKEIIERYVDKLQKAAEEHPDDASVMTADQFLEQHPEIFDTVKLEAEMQVLTHLTIPTTALTNLLKQFLNNPQRLESSRRNRITIEEHYFTKDAIITYKSPDAEYTLTINQIKDLFAKRVQNGAKVFNFLLQKLNEQNYVENTEFLLSELVDLGIYANTNSAYKGLKSVLSKMMKIHVKGTVLAYEGRKRKEIGYVEAPVIAGQKVTFNKCIAVLPSIIRDYTPFITILPRWGYALQSENAYILLDYIYYLARQNTDKIRKRGYFTIKLDTIRQHLGLPSPEEVKDNHGSDYNKLIAKPIEDAIAAIEKKQEGNEFKITPVYSIDCKNIHEYLDGYFEIRMSGTSFNYMEQRAFKEEIRIKENQRKTLPLK